MKRKHPYSGGDKRPQQRAGLTLVEVMVALAVLALLATLSVPRLLRARARAQDEKFVSDLRVIRNDVLKKHVLRTGSYPPDASEATVPIGLDGHNAEGFNWTEATDIGGSWEWDRAESADSKVHGICYACVRVNFPDRTMSQMAKIDSQIDDGDLKRGKFRKVSSGYILIIKD